MHIDFTKEGWQASNKWDHFLQMVNWLSHQEKILSFDFYRSWMESEEPLTEIPDSPESLLLDICDIDEQEVNVQLTKACQGVSMQKLTRPTILLAKLPPEPRKSILRIVLSHAAPEFPAQLKLFLNSLLPTDEQVSRTTALDSSLPFTSLDVWHQYKFSPVSLFVDKSEMTREVVKVIPIFKRNSCPRFDTVIVLDTDQAESTAVQGRLLFSAYILAWILTFHVQDVG